MFSFGQALIDEVTKEVTARKNKEFAATLERMEREWDRELLQYREGVARKMLAYGYSIDLVAEITLLPVGAVRSLSAQAARAAAEGSPLQEQPK